MRTISRLFVIVMILALGVASASTIPMGAASAKSGIAMSDMDCCPTGSTPMQDCQKDCPYLALCAAKCAPSAIVSAFQMLFSQIGVSKVGFGQDADHMGELIRPPAPPPRIQDMAGA